MTHPPLLAGTAVALVSAVRTTLHCWIGRGLSTAKPRLEPSEDKHVGGASDEVRIVGWELWDEPHTLPVPPAQRR